MKQVMLIMGLGLVLVSCASIQPEECKTADWEQLGYADAMAGRDSLLASYGQDCGKVGITPNKGLYLRGYDRGEKAFCTYDNGKAVGRRGPFLGKLCDKPSLAEPFNKGYREGLIFYDQQQRIRRQSDEIYKNLKEQERKNQESGKQAASDAEKARLAAEARLKLGIKTGDMNSRITEALKTQTQN